jgi:hypothetical protein
MRRTTAIFGLLAVALFWSGCGGANSNGGASANSEATDEAPARTGNSNMAPTGGPGPEPENAGSVKKNGNDAKAEANDNKKKAEANGNKKAP